MYSDFYTPLPSEIESFILYRNTLRYNIDLNRTMSSTNQYH